MMSPIILVITIFGAIFLALLWYISKMTGGTQYIAKRPDDANANPNELREQRKKALIKKIYTILGIWLFACICSLSGVMMLPRIQGVKAALGASATPTITNTPTITATASSTPTRMTSTPSATRPSGSPAGTHEPTSAPATQTPHVIIQQVAATVIVKQTVVVKQTVIVVVVVTATPTYTPSPTPVFTETASPTFTLTPSPTMQSYP